MKTALLVAAVVALVAAAAWALSGSRPASGAYVVEVCDVAGVPGLTVVPEVAVTAPGHLVMPEVVVRGAPDEVRSQTLEARGRKSGQPGREEV
jgi:hypothetical protein